MCSSREPASGRNGPKQAESTPHLRKTLGQHHLVRPEAVLPLLRFLEPDRAAGSIVEIGPGGGLLTKELLDAAGGRRVLAVEIDPSWAAWLRQTEPDRLSLWIGDAKELPFGRLRPGSVVAGNLPYNVATFIVQSLLREGFRAGGAGPVARAGFLVQKEVGERLVASPGTKAYGALSVLVAARADATLLGRVKPGAFRPPPKVESAFVGLRARAEGAVVSDARFGDFIRLVRSCFAQRRKTLRNNLAEAMGKQAALRVLEAADLDPGERAERLDLAAFRQLFEVSTEGGTRLEE